MGAFKKLLIAALLLAVAFGLWTSFHYTFKAYVLEGDSAVFPMLWRGWQEHGFAFFKTWYFTQDNWLLSPAPLVFLVYYVFGATGYTVLGLGWAFFVINTLLSAAVVRLLAGKWTPAALAITGIGLFASEGAIKNAQLAHPISHNSTTMWVLLAAIAAACGMGKRDRLLSFILACIIFIAGVSDPWFNAACTLPLLLVLFLMFVIDRQHRRQSRNLMAGVAAGWALAYTRGLGLLSFLPKSSFHFVSSWSWLLANIRAYPAAIGVFFPVVRVLKWNPVAGAAFAIISVCIVFMAFGWLARNWKGLPARQAVITGFLLCSIFVTSVAFATYAVHEDAGCAKFLNNIYFGTLILCISVFVLRWAEMTVIFRAAACVWALIFIAAGAASDPAAWENRIEVDDNGAAALAGFLEQNELHYGYADYWAVPAEAISWTSGYHNIVRPVSLKWDPASRPEAPLFFTPYAYQTSRLWYEPADSKNQHRFFLILNMDWPGFVIGKAIPPCGFDVLLQAAERQFGKPDKTLRFYNCVVLVWGHSIERALPKISSADK